MVAGGDATRVISFQSFAIGCIENNLFALNVQLDFLKIKQKSDCYKELFSLNTTEMLKIIGERFKSAGNYENYYKNWLSPIEQALKTDYSATANILLFKLKLTEAESKYVLIE